MNLAHVTDWLDVDRVVAMPCEGVMPSAKVVQPIRFCRAS